MALPAPQTLADLLPKVTGGAPPSGAVYTEEWDIVVAALKTLALTNYPALVALLNGLQNAVDALPFDENGLLNETALPPISDAQQANLKAFIGNYLATPEGTALLKSLVAS